MKPALELRDLTLYAVLLGIFAFFAAAAPQFLSARNLSMLMIEFSITSVLALGMLLVILPGHIDLSAGSGVGLIGGVASVLVIKAHVPAPLALTAGLGIALLLWRAMGELIARQRLPAFIVTLGGLLVCKGLFWLIIQSTTIPVSPGGAPNFYSALTTYYLPKAGTYALAAAIVLALGLRRLRALRLHRSLGLVPDAERSFLGWLVQAQAIALVSILCGQFRGLPLPALILATVALLVHVLTQRTRLGRHLYAIGGNEEAAFLSGVPIRETVVTAFTLMGGLVALTGFLQTAYSGASTTTVGDLMELDAVAACVIGGTSLRGGRGTVPGVLLGALIMSALLSGMTLLAVPPEARFIARGVVLTLAAWLDVRVGRARAIH